MMEEAKLATGLFVVLAIGLFVIAIALFNWVSRVRERQHRIQLTRNHVPARFKARLQARAQLSREEAMFSTIKQKGGFKCCIS
jgi:hypothetical protein